MKTTILMVAIIATTLQIPKTFGTEIEANDSITSSDSLKSNDLLSGVLSAYLAIKNALVADDGKTTQANAKTLIEEINKVPMDKMTSKQHTAWMKQVKKLSHDAEHINGTDEIEHQREHFVTLSKNIYAVAKAFNTNTSILYYQYCPMANEGKGAYWISEKEKVNNPYMGKKMPSCGSTKETLKGK